MKVFSLVEANSKPSLVQIEIPRPTPTAGEILVRVRAAGVTPTELQWYPTTHTQSGAMRTNAVPGHEFSGIVEEVGSGTDGVKVGDEIYGMNDWFADGAIAEYCVTLPAFVAPKPQKLTHAEAASVPIGALTAWQGLFERAHLKAGETVLVHGGAGGVGVYAVQLAKNHGARVIATVSSGNLQFAKALGADRVIDYRTMPFESAAGKVDVVFDTVGGETLQQSWSILKDGGRMVTIAADVEGTTDDRAKSAFFIVEPRRDQLMEVAKMLDAHKIRPEVDTVVPFGEAANAFSGAMRRRGKGKVVVELS